MPFPRTTSRPNSLIRLTGSGAISIRVSLAGDLNRDDRVDGLDSQAWEAAFGSNDPAGLLSVSRLDADGRVVQAVAALNIAAASLPDDPNVADYGEAEDPFIVQPDVYPGTLALAPGGQRQLKATLVDPDTGEQTDISSPDAAQRNPGSGTRYFSSDDRIASVSDTGLITAHAAGHATLSIGHLASRVDANGTLSEQAIGQSDITLTVQAAQTTDADPATHRLDTRAYLPPAPSPWGNVSLANLTSAEVDPASGRLRLRFDLGEADGFPIKIAVRAVFANGAHHDVLVLSAPMSGDIELTPAQLKTADGKPLALASATWQLLRLLSTDQMSASGDPTHNAPQEFAGNTRKLTPLPHMAAALTRTGIDFFREVQLQLAWDAGQLELIEVRRGSLTVDMSSFTRLAGGEGTLLELVYRVAPTATGVVEVNLQWAQLNDTRLTLNPAPKLGADPTDGAIRVNLPASPDTPAAAQTPSAGAVIDFGSRYDGFEFKAGGDKGWLGDWLTDSKRAKSNLEALRIQPKVAAKLSARL